jgi:periplasmic protein TonB
MRHYTRLPNLKISFAFSLGFHLLLLSVASLWVIGITIDPLPLVQVEVVLLHSETPPAPNEKPAIKLQAAMAIRPEPLSKPPLPVVAVRLEPAVIPPQPQPEREEVRKESPVPRLELTPEPPPPMVAVKIESAVIPAPPLQKKEENKKESPVPLPEIPSESLPPLATMRPEPAVRPPPPVPPLQRQEEKPPRLSSPEGVSTPQGRVVVAHQDSHVPLGIRLPVASSNAPSASPAPISLPASSGEKVTFTGVSPGVHPPAVSPGTTASPPSSTPSENAVSLLGPPSGSEERYSSARLRDGENPAPVYPPEAKKKGYQGSVLLRVEVLSNGQVGEIELKKSSGHEILDRSAAAAVKRWKFAPAREGERFVSAWVNIPVKFQLQ